MGNIFNRYIKSSFLLELPYLIIRDNIYVNITFKMKVEIKLYLLPSCFYFQFMLTCGWATSYAPGGKRYNISTIYSFKPERHEGYCCWNFRLCVVRSGRC